MSEDDDETRVDDARVQEDTAPPPDDDGHEDENGADGLSARQKEILRLVAQHFERKEIANVLKISPHTVKAHIDAARKRIGVSTDKQAARWLAERDKARGITLKRQYPPKAIADKAGGDASSGHEQDFRPERELHVDQLERTGDSVEGAFGTGEAGPDRGQYPGRQGAVPHSRPGEGHHSPGGADGVADGWWSPLTRRLNSFNITQALTTIVTLAFLLALAFVMLIGGGATTMQAIQNLTGQTG